MPPLIGPLSCATGPVAGVAVVVVGAVVVAPELPGLVVPEPDVRLDADEHAANASPPIAPKASVLTSRLRAIDAPPGVAVADAATPA